MRRLLVVLSLLFGFLMSGAPALAAAAAKPLYRDPVYDGAADVSSIYDRARHVWTMFYTNRRATLKLPDRKDVAWVHGTPIGMATSKDGLKWTYKGMAKFPAECTGETLWAPEMYYENGTYHMWLTVVPGIFHSWGGGATSKIVHLTSPDLTTWTCSDTLSTGSERIIDPSVIKLPNGGYRLWYKDERAGSRIFAVDSPDLKTWTKVLDKPVIDTNAEGPKVFFFKGYYWLIADKWDGLLVLRSDDAATWTPQDDHILKEPGTKPTDNAKGQHADVIVNGDHAFIYYFVHQANAPEAKTDPYWGQRTVIQVAELKYADGKLTVDREATVDTPLKAPVDK
ncbi:MAG TPA: glycoside hydrolase family 43 [Asticcacaulis sp.]|nr:glycoside hydrolase family 43 [Asticcacaulis sp.]